MIQSRRLKVIPLKYGWCQPPTNYTERYNNIKYLFICKSFSMASTYFISNTFLINPVVLKLCSTILTVKICFSRWYQIIKKHLSHVREVFEFFNHRFFKGFSLRVFQLPMTLKRLLVFMSLFASYFSFAWGIEIKNSWLSHLTFSLKHSVEQNVFHFSDMVLIKKMKRQNCIYSVDVKRY